MPNKSSSQFANQLEALKSFTLVVADTGDLDAIEKYLPEDATTNPSLILKAAQNPKYTGLLSQCIDECRANSSEELGKQVIESFAVSLGVKISELIPGRISTEVDASLSFDTAAMIQTARSLINQYEEKGLDRSRVLIKLAATWEGIEAARQLEQENINCNLTLIFNFYQALACAQAGAFLISPFVGRILDWHKNQTPDQDFSGLKDPGVQSVSRIYEHFKEHAYPCVVMGASFRTIEEIQNLAGCDRLTISPQLMEQLANDTSELAQVLSAETLSTEGKDINVDEKLFRWEMNQDAMATEKLAEGIRNFTIDQNKLVQLIESKL